MMGFRCIVDSKARTPIALLGNRQSPSSTLGAIVLMHMNETQKTTGDRHSFRHTRYLLYTDQFRRCGKTGLFVTLSLMWNNPEYTFSAWLRLKAYAVSARPRWLMKPVSILTGLMHRHYMVKFGIQIPPNTQIGPGFYISHFGGIVVNANCIIGANCNISHNVTLGQANRGVRKGYPVIGNNVYIGPGVHVVGAVHIGDNVAIGAGCVVTRDVPDNAVVVGVPGKVISYEGVEGYICHTDYASEENWSRQSKGNDCLPRLL